MTVVPADTAAGYETLQHAELQDFRRSLRCILRFSQFVAVEIRDKFSALLKHRGDKTKDSWFTIQQIPGRPLEELGNIRISIIRHRRLSGWVGIRPPGTRLFPVYSLPTACARAQRRPKSYDRKYREGSLFACGEYHRRYDHGRLSVAPGRPTLELVANARERRDGCLY